jgi:hypothetical protein
MRVKRLNTVRLPFPATLILTITVDFCSGKMKGLPKAVAKISQRATFVPMSNLNEFKGLLSTAEPAELGPGPRAGVESQKVLTARLQAAFANTELTNERQELVRALILLWHDHLDVAHGIAQSIENSDGAFVHAIMHRREPDSGNSAYWFRRVGRHGAFPEIASRVSDLLRTRGETKLERKLVPDGEWKPVDFVNACERADGGEVRVLREVQRVEFEVLLEWFCR